MQLFLKSIDSEADHLNYLIKRPADHDPARCRCVLRSRGAAFALETFFIPCGGTLSVWPSIHQLDLQITADLPPVMADSGRIGEVLTNLVENACKHSPAGSDIRIEARTEDGQIVISVSDSGEGIPPELQSRIFESSSASNASLAKDGRARAWVFAFAKALLRPTAARFGFESTPGSGTPFQVYHTSLRGSKSMNENRILVVDDEQGDCDPAAGEFERPGAMT